MKRSNSASAIAAKAKQPEYKIEYPPEVAAKLATLPKLRNGPAPHEWLPWQDKLITDEWYNYEKEDLAELCGVSKTAVKSRRRYLMREVPR